MQNDLEGVFRSLKSELGMRPIYHRTEKRVSGHIFITLLAYHLVQTLRLQLKSQGIHDSWQTLRCKMESQQRVTATFSLESSVGQYKECCCGGVWLGVTTWNGYSLSSSYNDGIRHHSSAIYTVATFTHRVKSEVIVNNLQIIVLFLALSGQLRNLGSVVKTAKPFT